MSPKQITRLALVVGGLSAVGLAVWPGWAVWGLAAAVLLLAAAYLRGAYLAGQKRAAMADKLNDCYTGVPENSGPPTQIS
jgi:hypothetical protein